MKRSGLITTKIGMTRLYDDGGVAHPVTVLSVGDCTVIGNRKKEKNGYQFFFMQQLQYYLFFYSIMKL